MSLSSLDRECHRQKGTNAPIWEGLGLSTDLKIRELRVRPDRTAGSAHLGPRTLLAAYQRMLSIIGIGSEMPPA
jgi:hypothetical protein